MTSGPEDTGPAARDEQPARDGDTRPGDDTDTVPRKPGRKDKAEADRTAVEAQRALRRGGVPSAEILTLIEQAAQLDPSRSGVWEIMRGQLRDRDADSSQLGRWGRKLKVTPRSGECRYCGSGYGQRGDCPPATCLACGSRQCGHGFAERCVVCHHGLLNPFDTLTGEPLICGYSGCEAPAVAEAPRVGRVCGGHLDRVTLAAKGTWRKSLAEWVQEKIAERDIGGPDLAWTGPGGSALAIRVEARELQPGDRIYAGSEWRTVAGTNTESAGRVILSFDGGPAYYNVRVRDRFWTHRGADATGTDVPASGAPSGEWTAVAPEVLQHWEAGNVSTSLLAEAQQLAVGDSARGELVEAITSAPLRGWLPVPRRSHAITVQWEATRITPPPVPGQSVKVTLILPDFRFVLGVRTAPGGQFRYRDVTDAEALAALLVPEGTLPDDTGAAGSAALAPADPAPQPEPVPGFVRPTGTCTICGTTMIIIESGQAAHPMCEDGPVSARAAVTARPVDGERNKAAGSGAPADTFTPPGTDQDEGSGYQQAKLAASPGPDEDEDDDAHAQARIAPERLREAAHRYLDDGLLPVPAWAARQNGECCCPRGADCDRPGKHPHSVRIGPGPRDYSWKPLTCRSHDEIDNRFADGSEYAAGNLMVAIPEGMMAIDRDDDDGGRAAAAALAEEMGDLPPTLAHKTPHGEHQIYRTPPGWKGRAWVGKAPGNPVPPGIDLRMPGQILMAASSVVPGPNGPATYGPVTDDHVAPLPAAYVAAWTPPQLEPRSPAQPVPVPPDGADRAAKYVHDAMTRITEDLASREPGGRNAAAYAAGLKAGSLLGAARTTPGAEHAAWTDEQAEQALLEAAQRNGYASKDGDAEALRAIRSGLRNGQRRPRTLPDFSISRPPAAPQSVRQRMPQRSSQAQEGAAAAKARRASRWQDAVPDDIRSEIEAADKAAGARRRAAIIAHQQALEEHDRAATPGTAAAVERTRAAADAAHKQYTHDGRHITGRHDAAMLRWAASIAAQRERAAAETAGTAEQLASDTRAQADAAAAAANKAYRAGDLEQARQLTDQAAAADPSRTALWQQYRDQITARKAVLASRQSYHDGHGDWQRADQLLAETRQFDPRTRGRAIWDADLPAPAPPNPAPCTQLQPDSGKAATAEPPRSANSHRDGITPPAAGRRDPSSAVGERTAAPGWPSRPARRATQRAPRTMREPDQVPQPAERPGAPPEPQTGEDPAADHPDRPTRPPSADPSSWPAPSPRARPEAVLPGAEPGHHDVTEPGIPAEEESADLPASTPGQDWSDAFINAERESWQPQPITPYDPAVFREPQTSTHEEEIEPGR
jgi:hypothetical protein